MKGGAPRAVWLTLGADPHVISALSAAQRLDQLDRPCHLVWNPLTGEIVQLVPIVRAGCSLTFCDLVSQEGPANVVAADPYASGPLAAVPTYDETSGVHTEGRVCVQLGVVAFGWEPFTSGPVKGLAEILDWVGSWGVPRRWPAGPPAAFARAHSAPRSRKLWARGGHYGASQVPGCTAAGPGAINIEMLTGASVAAGADSHRPRAGMPPQRSRPTTLNTVDRAGGRADGKPAGALARVG